MSTETIYMAPGGAASVSRVGGAYLVQRGGSGPLECFSDFWTAIGAARRAAGFPGYRADGSSDERRPRR